MHAIEAAASSPFARLDLTFEKMGGGRVSYRAARARECMAFDTPPPVAESASRLWAASHGCSKWLPGSPSNSPELPVHPRSCNCSQIPLLLLLLLLLLLQFKQKLLGQCELYNPLKTLDEDPWQDSRLGHPTPLG